MKYLFYIVILLFSFHATSQNRIQKLFSDANISTININGNGVFKISVETTMSNTFTIDSRIEGENNEHVVLIAETKNDTLYIATKYQPLFNDANDKLSAHKVISIELILNIPANKSIYVSSDIASVFVKGQYNNATIELINGNCILKNFVGGATVNTIQGDIDVNTNFAKLDAFTKNGTLNLESLSKGNRMLSLYSINGNITVIKSQ